MHSSFNTTDDFPSALTGRYWGALCPVITGLLPIPLLIGLLIFVLIPSALAAPTADQVEQATRENQRIIQEQQQREQLRRQEQEKKIKAPSGSVLPQEQPKAAPSTEAAKQCFQIDRVSLDGATKLSDKERQALIAPVIGKCVGLAEINQLIQAITNHYVTAGYTTTRAYIPEQDMSRGDLHILVLEGLVDKIMLEGSGVSLSGIFPGLEGEVFSLRDFEQGIDQINRLQSNSATMDITPGDKPGASVIVVRNQPRRAWTFNTAADNTGSDSTGYVQASATAGFDNLFGINDFINLSWRNNPDDNPDRRRSRAFSASATVPYGYWSGSISASDFTYVSVAPSLAGEFQTSGRSKSLSLKLDRVMLRDSHRKWTLAASVTAKESLNFINKELIAVNSRKLSVLDIDNNLSINALGGLWSIDLGLSRGLTAFGALRDPDNLPDNAPRAQFTKLKYGISTTRPVNFGKVEASYQTSVSGQYASDVLHGTEQTSIGGPFSVRGFRRFSISGDSGLYWRNELGFPIPLAKLFDGWGKGQIKPYLGYDIGRIADKHGNQGGILSGYTLGLNLNIASVAIQMAYSTPDRNPERFVGNDKYSYVRVAIDF